MFNDDFSSFEGFSATIKDVSIFDYLQLLIMTNKKKLVEIKSENNVGYIAVENGKIIFSKLKENDKVMEGLEAFLKIMTWKNGTFRDMDIIGDMRKNIFDNRNLLLLAAEAIDKARMTEETAKNN